MSLSISAALFSQDDLSTSSTTNLVLLNSVTDWAITT